MAWEDGSQRVSRSLKARAWACMALAWDERSIDPDAITCNVDSVHRAADCADIAAQFGFVPPVTLMLGTKIANMKDCLPSADPKLSLSAPRFQSLVYFWKAVGDRNREYEAERSKKDAKMAQRPGAYRCAAVGCGTEATSQSGLTRAQGSVRRTPNRPMQQAMPKAGLYTARIYHPYHVH